MERESSSILEPGHVRVQGRLGRTDSPTRHSLQRSPSVSSVKEGPMTRTPVVWIVNEGGHTYEKAEQFGRLIALTRGNVNHFNLDRLMVNVGPRLQAATEDDYLLVSGTPILNGLVVSMWLAKFSKANLLQWSTRADGYVLIVLHRAAVHRMANMVDLDKSA